MPDVFLYMLIIGLFIAFVIFFFGGLSEGDLHVVSFSGLFVLLASILIFWLVYANNQPWKYITTDSYANLVLDNAIHTVVIYKDKNGYHVFTLPYTLDEKNKYIIKIPNREVCYSGIWFTPKDKNDDVVLEPQYFLNAEVEKQK